MKLRIFGGHKQECSHGPASASMGIARSPARDSWMGRQIVADIGGSCEEATAMQSAGAGSSKRIAARMGAPVWLA